MSSITNIITSLERCSNSWTHIGNRSYVVSFRRRRRFDECWTFSFHITLIWYAPRAEPRTKINWRHFQDNSCSVWVKTYTVRSAIHVSHRRWFGSSRRLRCISLYHLFELDGPNAQAGYNTSFWWTFYVVTDDSRKCCRVKCSTISFVLLVTPDISLGEGITCSHEFWIFCTAFSVIRTCFNICKSEAIYRCQH